MIESSSDTKLSGHRIARVVVLFAVVIALLHFWAAFSPGASNWGVHFFAFFPDIQKIVFPLLMLVCLFSSVQELVLKFSDRLIDKWNKSSRRKRTLYSTLVIIGVGVLFWSEREATTFLGDGFWLLRVLPDIKSREGLLPVFGHEPLAGYIIWSLYKILNTWQVSSSAHVAFALISVICGIAFLIVLAVFIRNLTSDSKDRFWFYAFIIVTGGTQLFFGYIENYSPAYLGYVFFLITGLLCLRDRVSILVPSIAFAILFVFYFGMLAFAPVLLLLYIDNVKKRRFPLVIVSFIASLATTAFLLAISGYSFDAFLQRFGSKESHILPLFELPSGSQGYTMFSYTHLLELANAHLLLSPFALFLFFILVLAGFKSLPWKNMEWLFILLNAVCGLIMMTIFLSDLGISRDWDLMSVFEVGLVVAVAYLVIHSIPNSRIRSRVFFVITFITFLHTTGFVLVNADESRALPRSDILAFSNLWGRRAYVIYEQVAMYYRDQGNNQEAKRNYLNFLEHDSTNSRILGNLADVYHDLGIEDSEIVCLEQATRHDPLNKLVYINLAKLYLKRLRIDEATEMTLKGLMSEISSADTLTDLGIYAIKLRQDYAGALQYFRRAINLDSTYADAYLNAGLACYGLNNPEEMKPYLKKFLELQPDSPKAERIRQLINATQ